MEIDNNIEIKLDITHTLSYKEYLSNEFLSIRKYINSKMNKEEILEQIAWLSQWNNMSASYKQFEFLFDYDLLEKFTISENLYEYSLNNFLNYNDYKLALLNNVFYWKIPLLNKEIYDYTVSWQNMSYKNNPKTKSDYEEQKNIICENVKITQKKVQHDKFWYIFFLSIISEEDYFLIFDKISIWNVFLVSRDKIANKINYTAWNIFKINDLLYLLLLDDELKSYRNLNKRYCLFKESFEKTTDDIKELMKNVDSFKLQIECKNKEITYWDCNFKVKDVSRIEELKKYVWDHWGVYPTWESWQWKILEWRKKYKRKK